jgi:hypothetical protein
MRDLYAASLIGHSPPLWLLLTSIVIAWLSFHELLEVQLLWHSKTLCPIWPSFPMQ